VRAGKRLEKFLKNMNEILAWAKIPAVTEAQLLAA
jgi:hypothetical protein